MVFCTYCGHSFTRDEHLERHILTHTNIKPFKCLTCHMSFARRDLLQRHYTVHGKNQDNQDGIPSIMIPKTAGRTPIACTNCAKTKTKCDKKFPCSRCSSRNLKCVLRPTRRVPRNNVNRPQMKANGNENSCSSSDHTTTGIATPDDSKGNSPQPQPQSEQPIGFYQPIQTQSPTHMSRTPEPRQSISSDTLVSFFGPPSSVSTGQSIPSMVSPLPTPASMVNGFISETPMSGYEEFAASTRAESDESSPRFMMDWAHLHFSPPPPMDNLIRSNIMMGSAMHNGMNMSMDTITDPSVLSMLPHFGQSIGPLQTPLATPRMSMSTTLSDIELGSSTGALGVHTRNTSYSEPSSSSGDLSAVIKAQEGWNCFRSAPVLSPDICPRTAKLHLERLEHSLKNHESWNTWRPAWDDTDTTNDHLDVVPLAECSKDKLLAITQTFLHRALETHRNGSADGGNSQMSMGSNFVILPSIKVLTYFIRSYANSFERYFPMTSRGTLNMNELMMDPHISDRASSLLTLMMIAAGALYVPSIEARWLNGGLTEACRISLLNSVESNISMASDHTLLHSALLFISTAAWGGDKWHMNIAMGQRGMYSSMLRHSGALELQPSLPSSQFSPHELWREWLQNESKSRLVYSWVMLDQDLSFFHDCNPMFTFTELGAPMPDSDRLWHAKSASEWSTLFSQVHDFNGISAVGTGVRPLSLRDMFSHFMEDNIRSRGMQLTPLHLRLLLHPLQSMVCQYRQLSSCMSDGISSPQTTSVHTASVRTRFDELRVLLDRWQSLADRYLASHPLCAIMQASLIMFHLISLNMVVSTPDIERFARKENTEQYPPIIFMRKRCISNTPEAVFHAGQVLRLTRNMSNNVRPAWWAGGIYRAALTLWMETLIQKESMTTSPGMFNPIGQPICVDSLPVNHPVLTQYRSRGEGIPSLTDKNGNQIRIDDSYTTLNHCIEIVEDGIANRFSDGIRNKLQRLAAGG